MTVELGTGNGWGEVVEVDIDSGDIYTTGNSTDGVILLISHHWFPDAWKDADGPDAMVQDEIRFSAGRNPDGVIGSATGECPFAWFGFTLNNDPALSVIGGAIRYPSISAGVPRKLYIWRDNASAVAVAETDANGAHAVVSDHSFFYPFVENPTDPDPAFKDLTSGDNDLSNHFLLLGASDRIGHLIPGLEAPYATTNGQGFIGSGFSIPIDFDSADGFTIDSWVRRETITNFKEYWGVTNGTQSFSLLINSSNDFRVRVFNFGNGGDLNGADPGTLGDWVNYTITVVSGTGLAYVNGVQADSEPWQQALFNITDIDGHLGGATSVDQSTCMFSYMPSKALSGDEVATRYAYWKNVALVPTVGTPEATAVPRTLALEGVRTNGLGTLAIMYLLDSIGGTIQSTLDSKVITDAADAFLSFSVTSTLPVRIKLIHADAKVAEFDITVTTSLDQSVPASNLQPNDRIYDSTANLRADLEWIVDTSNPSSFTIQLYQGQIAQIALAAGFTAPDAIDRGKEITGSISSATGIIGTYTGNTLLVRPTSGTFQSGDVLSVTGGGTVAGTIDTASLINNNLVGVRPTLQAVYSSIKKFGWFIGDANGFRADIVQLAFPFIIEFGSTKIEFRGDISTPWNFADNASRNLITDGGWAVVSDFTVRPVTTTATYINIDLPPGTDVAGNNIYAAFSTVSGFLSPFDLTEESQAFLYLPTYTRLDVFERTFGKLPYSHLSITELDYIATPFAVPETFDDLKISVTESDVQNNAPFTGMSISTQAGAGFTAWADATAYAINDVVSDGDRWYRATTAGTSSGTGVGDDTGITWVAYEGERQVNGTYHPFTRLLDRGAGTLNQSYAWVQEYLANTGQTDEVFALYEGDIMVLQQPGDFIENFATGFDSETTQLRMTAADGTVINFSPPLSLSVPGAADGSRIQIQRVETHVFSTSDINTTTNEITLTGHQLTATSFPSLIRLNFADDATLPTSTPQIIDGGVYFVRTIATNLITLSTTEGGSTIDFTDAGSDGAIAFCTATGLTELDNRVVSGGGGYIQSFTLNAGTVLILKGIDWASSGGNASASNFVQETLVWSAAGATSLAQINRATNPDTIHNQIVSLSSIPLARTLVDLNGNQVSSLTPISDGSTLTGIGLALEGVGRLQINANDQDGLLAVVDLYLYGVYFSHTEGGIRLVNSDTFTAIDLFNFQIMNLEIDNTSSDFLQVVGATLSDIDGKGIVSPSTTGSVAINVGTTGTGALIETGVSGLTADESNQLSNAAIDSATAATNTTTILSNVAIVDTTVDTIQTDVGTLLSNLSTVDTKTSNIEDVIELLGYSTGQPLTRVTIGNTTTLTVGSKVVTIVDTNDTTTTITRTS